MKKQEKRENEKYKEKDNGTDIDYGYYDYWQFCFEYGQCICSI